MDISIVIPAYNEEKNVEILYKKIKTVLDRLNKKYEIIYIDDGSTDDTFNVLKNIHLQDKNVKIISFRRNYGQSAAFDAGFKAANGDITIAMDADLQNDPEDIPLLLAKMDDGYDVVSGWRFGRRDPFLKKVSSKFANAIRRLISREKIHDSGCSLKAYRKKCFKDLDLYGEMHRFIPTLLLWKGFKVGEVKVRHYPRKHGKTKYGIWRILKGFLDLLVVMFWQKYSARPIHLFGGFGLLFGTIGFLVGLYLIIMKIIYGVLLSNRPLLLLSMLLMILGVQLVIFGILADILIKIYYKGRKNYGIKKELK